MQLFLLCIWTYCISKCTVKTIYLKRLKRLIIWNGGSSSQIYDFLGDKFMVEVVLSTKFLFRVLKLKIWTFSITLDVERFHTEVVVVNAIYRF